MVEILCLHYRLHSGSHQIILFTHKDLAASESGFFSKDIYMTASNPTAVSLEFEIFAPELLVSTQFNKVLATKTMAEAKFSIGDWF